MGILIRLILFFYVLAVLVALIAGAAVCLNLIPTQTWQTVLKNLIAMPETPAVIGAMILASFCLLFSIFSGKKKTVLRRDFIELQKGLPGEVKITLEAISTVAERAALAVNGVREVQVSVEEQSGDMPVKVRQEIVLGQGFAAPEVSAEVVSAVDDALMTALQIPGVPVEIKVVEVTHAVTERARRVV